MFTMIKIKKETKCLIKDIAREKGMTIYGYIEKISKEDYIRTSKENRAYQEKISTLPFSFKYKIRQYFHGKNCPICGCKMLNTSGNIKTPSIQHNIPISKGGNHDINNISVICRSCNNSIKNKTTESLNNAEVLRAWDEINEVV